MEVKVMKPQLSVTPDSPRNKQDSRGTQIIQYLSKTVSGNSFKDPNTHTLHNSSVETRPHDVSDSEESDEDVHAPAHTTQTSSDTARPSLLQKLSNKLSKTESSHIDEEKGHQSEGANGWGVRSVLEVSKGVAADLRGSFGRLLQMKSMLIEKLSSMPTIPAETLEHARHSIESIISDATQSAYGKTRDAMSRIRLKLVEIIPSLTPHETKKIVDDVEREVLDMSKATSKGDSSQTEKTEDQVKDDRVGVSASTASAVIAPQPASGLAANVDRLKAWAFMRSRL
eukprot:c7563_g1_i1 orf=274-1125(-)